MKIAAMVVGIILITISCASIPTGPLAPGELRLISLKTPENIQAGIPYDVTLGFQTNDPVQIAQGCFSWNTEGPYCFRVGEIDMVTKTIKVRLRTGYPNSYALTGYVEYRTGGTIKKSNQISTTLYVR